MGAVVSVVGVVVAVSDSLPGERYGRASIAHPEGYRSRGSCRSRPFPEPGPTPVPNYSQNRAVVQGINKGIPLKAVATMGRYNGLCWASWPDVPLTGPDSLLGKNVSISSSSTFFQIWPAFQKKFGIDAGKVKVVSPDPSARFGLFLQHKLDILADLFYANDYVIIQSKTKEKLNLLKLSDLDFDPLGYVLTVNGNFLAKNPDTVRRMVGATLGKNVLEGQIHNMPSLILQDPGLGKATDDLWNASLSMLYDAGVITKKQSPSSYYTNEYLG